MTTADLHHVAYLGAFAVSGQLWRGDLYRDDQGSYWAEQTVTRPDGSWASALHRVRGSSVESATATAVMMALDYFTLNGSGMDEVDVIHSAPPSVKMMRLDSVDRLH